jgi:hypothetical protein
MMTRFGNGMGEPPPYTPRESDADPAWQPCTGSKLDQNDQPER